ncbi:hypothetical protein PG990_014655 [Apiospora arundinis]
MPDTTPYEDNGKGQGRNGVGGVTGDVGKTAKGASGTVGDTAKGITSTVGRATGTKDATDKVGNTIKSITDTAGDATEGVTGAVGDTVNDTTSGATGKVSDIVGEPADDAGETINDAEGIAEKAGVATEKGGKTVEGAEDKIDKAGDNVEVPEGAEDRKCPIEVSEFGPSITVKVVHIFEGSFIVSDNGQVKDRHATLCENNAVLDRVGLAPEGTVIDRIRDKIFEIPEAGERLDTLGEHAEQNLPKISILEGLCINKMGNVVDEKATASAASSLEALRCWSLSNPMPRARSWTHGIMFSARSRFCSKTKDAILERLVGVGIDRWLSPVTRSANTF